MEEKDYKRFVMPVTILVFAIMAFFILKPLIIWIATGLTLAYILNPLFIRFNRKIKSRYLSSSIVLILTLFVIILPIILFIPATSKQVLEVYGSINSFDGYSLLQKIAPFLLQNPVVSTEIQAALSQMKTALSDWILSYVKDALLNLPNIVLGILITLFTFFFSMIESDKLKEYLSLLFPFQKNYQEKFFDKFQKVTDSVIYGHIIVGLIQGLIAGIGYYILGVPQALLLTILTTVLSVLPIIGPWLVWIPVDIYLFAQGNTGIAMGLLIYGLFVINWIDTLLRPQIVANKAEMNSAIALIGTIGGMYAFGVIGILIGPLVLAYLILLVELYKDKNADTSIVIKEEPPIEPKTVTAVKVI